MLLCVFPRDKLWDLYTNHPTLAFDVTWLAAREEQMLDEHLVNIGRRTALERIAYLMMHLFVRAEEVGMTRGSSVRFPFTQQHIADTLGMSLVHANKTLRRLAATKTVRWRTAVSRSSIARAGGMGGYEDAGAAAPAAVHLTASLMGEGSRPGQDQRNPRPERVMSRAGQDLLHLAVEELSRSMRNFSPLCQSVYPAYPRSRICRSMRGASDIRRGYDALSGIRDKTPHRCRDSMPPRCARRSASSAGFFAPIATPIMSGQRPTFGSQRRARAAESTPAACIQPPVARGRVLDPDGG